MSQWLAFYKTRRWQRLRTLQLKKEPLCKMCLEDGFVIPASVVDHVVPHNGDWNLFVTGKLQSLCDAHHNSTKKQEELNGYSPQIGEDGWPVDKRHPVYQGQRYGRSK
jgi:5-methylcytosine-specific restriction endonuclease McrA